MSKSNKRPTGLIHRSTALTLKKELMKEYTIESPKAKLNSNKD